MSELNEHDAGSRAPFLSFIPRDRDPQSLTSAYIRHAAFSRRGTLSVPLGLPARKCDITVRADSEALTTPFVAGYFSLAG